jgi:arsenate reductase (thioredoxin)
MMSNERRLAAVILGTILGVVAQFAVASSFRPQGQPTPASGETRTPTVLFLCPHGAAKSVLASARFQQLAKERGLKVRVEAAGTDPDERVSPQVVSHLQRQGLASPVTKPRKVSETDLAAADVVISIGCDLNALPVRPRNLRTWDEVPSPSADLPAADAAIRRRVTDLVEELLATGR